MSSDNKDIPDNEVVEPVDGEVDSGETESLDVETDALTEVEALQEELAEKSKKSRSSIISI